MAAQAGIDLVVNIDTTGSGSFSALGGARTNSMSINNTPIDVTSASSSGHWREFLDEKPNISMSLSVSGVFQDDSQDGTLRTAVLAADLKDYQMVVPDFGTFEGPFICTSYTFTGSHDGELTYEASFESGGAVTFT